MDAEKGTGGTPDPRCTRWRMWVVLMPRFGTAIGEQMAQIAKIHKTIAKLTQALANRLRPANNWLRFFWEAELWAFTRAFNMVAIKGFTGAR